MLIETDTPAVVPWVPLVVPAQVANDEALIASWLHGRGAATTTAYSADVRAFREFVAKPLRTVTVPDVQAFSDSLRTASSEASALHVRQLAAVKSLLSFAHRVGYLPFDVGRPVRKPVCKNRLAERIVGEGDVHRLLALETNPRNAALLWLLYGAGVRLTEAVTLAGRDLSPHDDGGGQATIMGKGGRTRVVRLEPAIWRRLEPFRVVGGDEPVFRAGRGPMTAKTAYRVVKAAAARAGLPAGVSPHWFRHAHASHALDRGAPIHVVTNQLGHASVATTSAYLHVRPREGSGRWLAL